MRLVCKYVLNLVAVLVAVFTMHSCTLIYEWPEEHEILSDAVIKVLIEVPVTKAPVVDDHYPDDDSDSLQHEGEDSILRLDDLEFFFFGTDGQYITSARGFDKVTLTGYSYTGNKHRYAANIRVSGLYDNQYCRVVVLANRRPMYSTSLPFSVSIPFIFTKPLDFAGTDEEYFYSQLLISTMGRSNGHNLNLSNYTMLNLSANSEACVPMWGVQGMVIKCGSNENVELSGEIDLLRSIAKVKVRIEDDLRKYVKIVDYQNNNDSTGVVLSYTRDEGLMAPSYLNARADTTWNSLGKDRDGLTYINANVNTTASTGNFHAPFFKDSAGDYYIYLTEQMIGEASINLRFEYLDQALVSRVRVSKKLLFADYKAASDARGADLVGVPLTDEQLHDYRFPVMRNHYYIFEVTRIDPLEVKFQVCEWETRNTDIYFD